LVVAGRKIRGVEGSTLAIGTATITGAGETSAAFSFAFGTEQIEQVWRGDLTLSGCEWTACAIPMLSNIKAQSTATTPLHRS
jgi:hypothetical protein